MPRDTISLKEVLDAMDSGKEFTDLVYITIGGERIAISNAIKHNWLKKPDYEKLQELQPASTNIFKKDPRHRENKTRNIRILANGEIRKLKIRLIRRFEGKTVL